MCENEMERLAEVWYEWDREDDVGQVLQCQQFEEQISVKRTQCPRETMVSKFTSLLDQKRQVGVALCVPLGQFRDSTSQGLRTTCE